MKQMMMVAAIALAAQGCGSTRGPKEPKWEVTTQEALPTGIVHEPQVAVEAPRAHDGVVRNERGDEFLVKGLYRWKGNVAEGCRTGACKVDSHSIGALKRQQVEEKGDG